MKGKGGRGQVGDRLIEEGVEESRKGRVKVE